MTYFEQDADKLPNFQEIHIIRSFPEDFHGQEIRAAILGYIRPEKNYPSRGRLIDNIWDTRCHDMCMAPLHLTF